MQKITLSEKTTAHCVVTGRKNYESIPEKFRPLPNRTNIVITRQKNYITPQTFVVGSIEEAIKTAEQNNSSKNNELFIIGGAEIYKQSIDLANRIYLTKIHHSFEGDAFFPEINNQIWKEVSRTKGIVDEKNIYEHDFLIFEKIS